MIDEIVISQDASPQLQQLVADINDRLETLDREVELGPFSQRATNTTATGTQQAATVGPYSQMQPTVNVFNVLDPLYQSLRSNEVALRDVRIGFDSVGDVNLQTNSVRTRSLVAGAVTTETLAAGAVTAGKIDVNELSAITANLGTILAGNITLDSTGYIRGGATGYNTGTGFWLGYDSTAYKFFVGNSAGDNLTWNGAALALTGSISAASGTIGGFTITSTQIYAGGFTLDSLSGLYFTGTTTVSGGWKTLFDGNLTFSRTSPAHTMMSIELDVTAGVINGGKIVLNDSIGATNLTLTGGDGSIVSTGTIQAFQFDGDGSLVTGLNASNVTSGTLATSYLPATINIATAYQVGGTQVLGPRITGWIAATGTPARGTFVTSSVSLSQLASHVKALIDDAMTHGWIGN